MINLGKTFMACCLLVILVVYPLSAFAATAQESPNKGKPSAEAMGVDLLLARPIGLVATVGGTVLFLVSLPFSALGGNTDEAWNKLVADPSAFTFHRPLGVYEE